MWKVLASVVFVALVVGGGCVAPDAVRCGDLVCPAGNLCSPDGARCALPSQLEACADAPEGQQCTYAGNTGACVGGVCVGVGCGNNKVEPGEACDDGNIASGDGCSSDCQSNETCGNGYVDAKTGERCDDGNVIDGDGCSADCSEHCGNGVKDGGEECDGSDFGILTCLNYDSYEGALACDDKCKVNASACFATCGDSAKNGPELCDGPDMGGLSCGTYGWYSGTLTCSTACNGVDKAGCTGYCGDGIINGSEQCDGGQLGGESCITLGAFEGALDCNAFCQPTRDRCHWSRWRIQAVTDFFHDIAALAPDNVWTVGGQHVRHFNGATWTDVSPSVGFNNLLAIYATTAQDLWAVGDFGTVLHSDGTTWTTVYGTSPLTNDPLYDVWAADANNAWAVGANGTILHRTSAGWAIDSASGVVTTTRLKRVWGSGTNDVWAVGDPGNGSPMEVIHYNGTWSVVTGVTVNATDNYTSFGIWGTSPTNIWIVADAIYHFTGTWSTTASPTGTTLIDVRGTSANDIWADTTEGRLVHYNGTSWTQVGGTQTTGLRFWNISPSAGGDVWGADDSGIYHYDGPSWQDATFDSTQSIRRIWGTAANDIWAVGSKIFHYDGSAWSVANSTTNLAGVWGRNATDVWAVGGSGTIMHYNGSWSASPGSGGTSYLLYAVWGSAANDVWAVGYWESLWHYNGSVWTADPQSSMLSSGSYHPQLLAVWGSAQNDVWAGGDDGIYHYNGSTWSHLFGNKQIQAIWGTDAKDVWAVGADPNFGALLMHYDGTSWKVDPASGVVTNAGLDGVWGTSANDVWATEFSGGLLHYDGSRWSATTAITSNQTYGIWGSAPNDYWAAAAPALLHLTTSFPTEYGGACSAPIPLYCATAATPYVQFGSVSTTSTNKFSTYACGARSENGGETYYRLDVPVSGQVSVKMTPTNGDLDLVQVGADSLGGCAAAGTCMASENVGSGTAETITVNTTEGQTLYFIVDGPNAADLSYAIQATCIKQ